MILYHEINLGELFFTEFFHFLISFLKKYLELKKIFENFSDSIFHCSDDTINLMNSFSATTQKISILKIKKNDDFIDIKFNLINRNFSFRISKSNYNMIQHLIEKFTKSQYQFPKQSNPILLINLSTSLFHNFLSILPNSTLNFVKYDRITPSFWNLYTYHLIKQSKCILENQTTLKEKSFATKTPSSVDEVLNKLEDNDDFFSKFFVFHDKHFWLSFRPVFYDFCKSIFLQGINEIKITEKLFAKYNFSSIVLLQETRLHEQIIIKLAKKNSIPVIQILHGFFSRSESMLNFNKFVRAIPHYSDTYLVWGNSDVEYLSNSGYSKNKIVITGSPYFENIVNNKIEEYQKSKNYILFATDFLALPESKNSSINYIDSCKNILQKTHTAVTNHNFDLLVKPHPNKGIGEKDMIEQWPRTQFVSGDALPLIKSSEIVIVTDNSTLILEAMLLNKPVISIRVKNQYDDSDLFNSGSCIRTDIEDLPIYLNKILNDESFRNNLLKNSKEFLENNLSNIENPSFTILKYLEKSFK